MAKDWRPNKKIAENINTSTEVLDQLADSDALFVQEAVAKNPSTSIKTLFKLAHSDDTRLRLCVARNPSTPKEILELLVKDKKPSVRASVAGNKSNNMSIELLKILAADSDGLVRDFVSDHPLSNVEIHKIIKDIEKKYEKARDAFFEKYSPAERQIMFFAGIDLHNEP